MILHSLLALALNVVPGPSADVFPVAMGGPFVLQASNGAPRSEVDPNGRLQLLSFGYSNCDSMCPMIFPVMGEIAQRLGDQDIHIQPVLITVDPDRDTPAVLSQALSVHHPEFLGLTGDEDALDNVYAAFDVDPNLEFTDARVGDVFSHQSPMFLLSPQGEVLSVLPPVMPINDVALIIAKYAGQFFAPTCTYDQPIGHLSHNHDEHSDGHQP